MAKKTVFGCVCDHACFFIMAGWTSRFAIERAVMALCGKERICIYQMGDMVVHPGHGGCIVKDICSREFAGEEKRYYVLIPKTEPNTTILAPIENAQKIGLRDVITPEQADEILEEIPGMETGWVKDNAQRRQVYDKIFKTGSLSLIAQMIKELVMQGESGSLNQHDKELLPKAQRKLISEIALAKGIELERAQNLMDQAIHVAI